MDAILRRRRVNSTLDKHKLDGRAIIVRSFYFNLFTLTQRFELGTRL